MPKGLCFALLAAIFTVACASTPSTIAEHTSGKPLNTTAPKQLRERQIIVTLLDDHTPGWMQTRQALAQDYRLQLVGDFPLTSIRVQCLVYEVPSDRTVDEVVTQLRADPRVDSVQANQVFAGLRAHADMYASLLYGAGAIHAIEAHRASTGRGVKVAVIDTGIDAAHPDLRGRIAKTQNFVEGGEKSFARDVHGTGVAGVIAARADDGAGIFGVAPDAELLALKACWYPGKNDKALCSSWTLAKALDFAIVAQSQVVNMSLSGPNDTLLARLIARANEANISVIAAVAEGEATLGFPASAATVIAVYASDAKGHVETQSATKRGFIAAAPGVDILTTAPNDGYDFLSGSSLAAAHVSGVVALLKQANSKLSPSDVALLLASTAQGKPDVPAPRIVNACAALAKLLGKTTC